MFFCGFDVVGLWGVCCFYLIEEEVWWVVFSSSWFFVGVCVFGLEVGGLWVGVTWCLWRFFFFLVLVGRFCFVVVLSSSVLGCKLEVFFVFCWFCFVCMVIVVDYGTGYGLLT